jgi:LysM repeat protein
VLIKQDKKKMEEEGTEEIGVVIEEEEDTNNNNDNYYSVCVGDTFNSIALRYGIDASDLRRANHAHGYEP